MVNSIIVDVLKKIPKQKPKKTNKIRKLFNETKMPSSMDGNTQNTHRHSKIMPTYFTGSTYKSQSILFQIIYLRSKLEALITGKSDFNDRRLIESYDKMMKPFALILSYTAQMD